MRDKLKELEQRYVKPIFQKDDDSKIKSIDLQEYKKNIDKLHDDNDYFWFQYLLFFLLFKLSFNQSDLYSKFEHPVLHVYFCTDSFFASQIKYQKFMKLLQRGNLTVILMISQSNSYR